MTIAASDLASRSLLAPICGLGSTTVDIAERAFEALAETSAVLKKEA